MTDRTDTLELATDIARLALEHDSVAYLRHCLASELLDELHRHYEYLADLDARVHGSYARDRRADPRAFDAMTLLDFAVSEKTHLAEVAYEAALRALLFGYRLGADHPAPTEVG